MTDDHQDDDAMNLDEYRREEEREILYRLDERTERIDARIKRIDGRVLAQQEILNQHDDRIQRNTTVLNAITFGIGTLLTTLVAKLNGLIKF